MIHYNLHCAADHSFDGWFRDSVAFDGQAERGLITCPECGGSTVTRALMAPSIPRKGSKRKRWDVEVLPPVAPAPTAPETVATGLPDQVRAVLQRIRAEVERTGDYVGPNFADEARRIHRGESDRRNIYGESTPEQAESLADEGIEISQIPWVPRADG